MDNSNFIITTVQCASSKVHKFDFVCVTEIFFSVIFYINLYFLYI